MTEIEHSTEFWPLAQPFHIATHTITGIETVHVTVSRDGVKGCGEGVVPIVFDVTLDDTVEALVSAKHAVEAGEDVLSVCNALPAGPARNALDCAIWDMKAKASGASIWSLAGLSPGPRELDVGSTIGIGSLDDMAQAALRSQHRVLKIKLNTEQVIERVAAVRNARPDAKLIVDANQSWTVEFLQAHLDELSRLGVQMIEQPLPVNGDDGLGGIRSAIPIFADESCHTTADIRRVAALYQGVNIKLDKTGGLTEALALAATARQSGLGVMVGCMAGTSLSMAPAYVIASLSDWVDLDGPLLLASDRPSPMTYRDGKISHFSPALWG
ncbi:dipeptide epimerase [Agrobacterium sp. BA1120]|uniref:dipeptide epimerase n=1 Tax=Agrobacterium sp. BA1120 TaxID=3228927 RepID=UPI00336A6B63